MALSPLTDNEIFLTQIRIDQSRKMGVDLIMDVDLLRKLMGLARIGSQFLDTELTVNEMIEKAKLFKAFEHLSVPSIQAQLEELNRHQQMNNREHREDCINPRMATICLGCLEAERNANT